MLVEFEPVQIYSADIDTFVEGRRFFTTQEWVDLLVKSMGLNPDHITRGRSSS